MSTTTTCKRCGTDVPTHSLINSEHGLICPSCELDDQTPMDTGSPMALIIAGLFAVVPFFASYVTGSGFSQFGIGLNTNMFIEGKDHVAFVAGLMALLAGAGSLKGALNPRQPKYIVASLACMALGLLHILVRSGYVL